MAVEVRPEVFTFVDYDAAEIRGIAEQLLGDVGLAGQALTVEVHERTPLSRVSLLALDPLEVSVEGGAFEDLRRPRTLDPDRVIDALGLPLLQARDRLDPPFGAPGMGDAIALPHRVAWDTYCMGRLARSGHRAQRQRRLYLFRNRHGFTDAADAAFDRLWTATDLHWPAIVALSDGLLAAA